MKIVESVDNHHFLKIKDDVCVIDLVIMRSLKNV